MRSDLVAGEIERWSDFLDCDPYLSTYQLSQNLDIAGLEVQEKSSGSRSDEWIIVAKQKDREILIRSFTRIIVFIMNSFFYR
jgi:hypothetical protein